MAERSITTYIDISKSEQYTLSIRLSTDGFSFSVYDPVMNKIFFEKKTIDSSISFTANVKRIFKETGFLQAPYKQVNVLMVNKRFTLIPLDLFDEEQIETFFYYNHNLKENEVVCSNVLRKNNVVVLFGVDKSIYNSLGERFKNIRWYSQLSPLIEHFTLESRSETVKKMYAYVRKNFIDIYCFDHQSLLLVNSYECNDDNDRQYYILYVWKQLGFNQQTDVLQLVGYPFNTDKILKALRRFIKEASAIKYQSVIPFDMEIMLSLNS